MVLMGVAFDNRLDNVMNVVVQVLVNNLTLVDNCPFFLSLSNLVMVLVESCEKFLILWRVGVLLTNFRDGDLFVVVNGVAMLLIQNRLNMVLDVVDMAIVFTLADNFLRLVLVYSLLSDSSYMLVVVSRLGSSHLSMLLDVVLMGSELRCRRNMR